ncbi:PilX N-terminal domain-containing pilus assembly protein [Microbulbifer sp. OS29]|uniref:PilX N-terminal domain-containing pilus assembly protein n=1 Tax=Microbulbifer okhotskensis TaxID=2926617 RepID=A0A9X2J7T2_9GAMM|nr:PilX N-terminal domain-containing pilus assembly protein [Microbulbifer okhotskensis]MCO1334831.1 PilX N-terminal domain-containing pilus assembly protein [Microbulbifer okhotskensis]
MQRMVQQRGAVLIVSLIILLVLTLIGISGARGMLMNERMTSASRDAQIALEVAESMSRQGEDFIETLENLDSFEVDSWLHNAGAGPSDLFADSTWKDANSIAKDVPMKDADGSKKLQGRMFIERLDVADLGEDYTDINLSDMKTKGEGTVVEVFKIVSMGVGVANTQRIVVTQYAKEFDETK